MKYSESGARRAAKMVGLRAFKSRWRKDSIDSLGGFRLIDYRNTVYAGAWFELSANEVVEFAKSYRVAA